MLPSISPGIPLRCIRLVMAHFATLVEWQETIRRDAATLRIHFSRLPALQAFEITAPRPRKYLVPDFDVRLGVFQAAWNEELGAEWAGKIRLTVYNGDL